MNKKPFNIFSVRRAKSARIGSDAGVRSLRPIQQEIRRGWSARTHRVGQILSELTEPWAFWILRIWIRLLEAFE